MIKSRQWLSEPAFALAFTLLYAVLLAWFMQFHELWFDETEPWLLALYSDSYADLLYNKRFEGHPNLWYSVLYGVTAFTSNLTALQVTQGFFAVGFVYVFLRYAPFPRTFRLLFCFGYYGLFEYGTISRLYAIELLTLFIICAFYPKRFSHWYGYILLLALHAQTNLFGFFISGILGVLLLMEATGFWRQQTSGQPVSVTHKIVGALVWAIGCGYSFYSMFRPGEGSGGSFITFFEPYYFFQAATRIWQAFAPVPQFMIGFWNSSLLPTSWEIPLSMAVVVFIVVALYRHKQLLFPLLLLFATLYLFFALKFEGSARHHAHYFFFTLAFFWLYRHHQNHQTDSPSTGISTKWTDYFLIFCGCLQLAGGAYALAIDKNHPFFGGKQVVEFLKGLPPDRFIAISEIVTGSNVVAYYGKPIYDITSGIYRSYYTLNPHEVNDPSPNVQFDWARILAHQKGKTVILISRWELNHLWYPYPIKFVASFKGIHINPFSFFIYEIPAFALPPGHLVAGPTAQLPIAPLSRKTSALQP
ncbi:hypothetical protein [Rufibacter sp. LB8]|uniref:hypothetical protein n=1 Tax=Rufibacter sp. LB8 TaxID=2777781 RepID=UPI00178C7520|nr:hypothetical protein [Rufibacter sp. LB8]